MSTYRAMALVLSLLGAASGVGNEIVHMAGKIATWERTEYLLLTAVVFLLLDIGDRMNTWRRISPTGDEGGLLCPSCICKRLHAAGISNVPGAFMSGPIRSVEEPVMDALRRAENLAEQLARLEVVVAAPSLPEEPRP